MGVERLRPFCAFAARATTSLLLAIGAFAAGWVSMLPLLDYAVERALIPGRFTGTVVNGPWSTRLDLSRSTTPMTVRAYVAQIGLAANQAEEAIYWNAFADSAGHFLDGKHSYAVLFNARPPVAEAGFWSLTAYDADSFVVANQERRYSIGDRSPLKKRADGSFTILVSHQRGSEDVENWLGCPPKGSFSLTLRMYVPLAPVLEDPKAISMPQVTCLDCS